MNRCIYCKSPESEVTFKSQEHVFPAALGGNFKLPFGAVCDDCNTKIFSKLEFDFIRNSIVSLPRQFYGPGKRGSLNPDQATSSNVHVMAFADDSGEISLGKMRSGTPYQIPQLRFRENGAVEIIFDPRDGEVEKQINNFSTKMRSFTKDTKFVYIFDEILTHKESYFGFSEEKYYFAARIKESIAQVYEYMELLRKGELIETTERDHKKGKVQSRQRLAFNIETFDRVCAKIAFNALYFLTSDSFCSQSQFESIRNFIKAGGSNAFVSFLGTVEPEFNNTLNLAFPHLSHRVFFFSLREKGFLALLNFYGNFNVLVKLAEKGSSDQPYSGIICDWRNRTDYKLIEYLKQFGDS